MSDYPPNEAVKLTFYQGTTGLVEGDFTKTLFKNGISSAIAVTVTEISAGYYLATFTPDAEATWHVVVYKTTEPTMQFTGEVRVAKHELDLLAADHVTASTIGFYINAIKKYVANKLGLSGDTYTLYEDDGTTPYATGTSTTTERTPD